MSHASPLSATGKLAQDARTLLAVALLYFCADRLLDFFAFSEGWTIFWPLNGITIALMIMRPRSGWPLLLLGVALGTGAGEFFTNSLSVAIADRLLSLTEVILSALVLPHFTNLEEWLRQPSIYRKFCASLALGPIVSGIPAAMLTHHLQGQPYCSGFNDWATADALGIAIVMPLALSLRSAEFHALFKSGHLLRTVSVLTLTLAICALIFLYAPFQLFFLLYPILLLVDSILGFGGSALAMPVACLIAVYGETHGLGPFSHIAAWLPVSSGIALQVFLGFQVLALFPASIQFRQRKLLQLELKQTNLQLVALASIDGLTGIPNRRALDEKFLAEWTLAARLGQPLTLVMMDIDHFKQFNDLYGHHAGDACLKQVAAALTAQIRRSREMVGRFGGEEFALFLPGLHRESVQPITEKIIRAVGDLHILHQASPWGRVTLSAGCAARIPTATESPEDLLKLADAALYRAKRLGRNNVQFDFGDQPVTAVMASGNETACTLTVSTLRD